MKYKDLECCFSELGIDINPILDKFVISGRYRKYQCVNKKLSKLKESSIPSKLMIVLKRPIKKGIQTQGDIFFN